MDTTFPGNALMHRAITDKSLWTAAYASIIAAEALTGLLLVIGTLALLVRLTAPAAIFNRAKVWAIAGMTVGSGLWFSASSLSLANISPRGSRRNGTGRRLRSASPL